ncbi:putative LPS-assembly protein LptD [Burkholderiales bacterium]|nr:putative LPS-assembly protein LptD [Burkholderiales bacterium]
MPARTVSGRFALVAVAAIVLQLGATSSARAQAAASPPPAAAQTPPPAPGPSQPGAGGVAPAPPATSVAAPKPLSLRVERILGGGRARTPASGPVYVRADRVEGEFDENTILEGAVEVRHDGLVLRGERAVYRFEDDELKVRGKVHLVERGATFDGPALDFKLEAQTGQMPTANYTYAAKGGRGESRLIEFLSDDDIRMHDATYTTCQPDNPSWWIRAETIDINRADQDAIAHSTTLYFQGVPIFASPYFDLPLGDQRRSGVLTPGFYQNSHLGQEFIVPVYWNIAPNRDYTLTTDLMPRRGVSLGNEFRFLEPQTKGQLDFDVMPNDRQTGIMRDHIVLQSQYANFNGLRVDMNYNRVSDDNYFIDFSHNIVNASPEVLPQELNITYTRPYWNAAFRVDKSQTLVSLLATSDPGPYERVPDVAFNVLRADWNGFDLASVFDATRFQHPAINPLFTPSVTTYSPAWYSQDGSRFIANPSISYPFLAPGWFIVPKAQWHYTDYELDPTFHSGSSSAQRSLPIASVDSGLVFQRPSTWLGSSMTQTLEPRLYYAFIPFRDQSQLPNFDSADSDFNFAQLFTENSFTGSDRISEANQITTAVVTRMIDEESGAERLRLALGQRFYFGSQLVTLPGDVPRTTKESDTLFVGNASMGRKWSVDVGLDYSTFSSQIVLATMGFHWQPRAASVINFSYRYETAALEGSLIDQFRVSAQWPLSPRWYGVGALNYSVADGAWVETVGGVEYKADCWVGRFVLSRYAVTLPSSVAFSGNYTTTFFMQIELNGLTSVGTNPLDQLQRSITGFQRINPLSSPVGPFDHYE